MRRTPPEAAATRRLQQAFLGDLNGREPRDAAGRGRNFRRPPRGSAEDRWHVYAHGYRARLTEALELEYAAIARILGSDAFDALVGRYLAVFPPRSYDLGHAGDRLARFLEFDGLTVELPFLADLARLERAASLCFIAADADRLVWGELRDLAPERVASLRLGLAPGVALLESPWPLADLWSCRFETDDEAVSVPLEGRPARVLVYRARGRVRVEAVSEAEAAVVTAAGAGDISLEEMPVLSGMGSDAASLAAMLDAFRALFERGIFVHKRSTGWTGALEIAMEETR